MAAPVAAPTDRIWTVPNALSILRLAGVPFFLWLLLGPHADLPAVAVLMVSGFTDWADGALARKLNQQSRLGVLLDPAADRLYILATLFGLSSRHIIPWWLAAVIVGRDVILAVVLALLRRSGYAPLPVHYLGKAATFNLLYAFPLLLIGAGTSTVADIAGPIAWAFTIWGTVLYLWSGGLYALQAFRLISGGPLAASTAAPAGAATSTAASVGGVPSTAESAAAAPSSAASSSAAPSTAASADEGPGWP